jgi:hypothetical protein
LTSYVITTLTGIYLCFLYCEIQIKAKLLRWRAGSLTAPVQLSTTQSVQGLISSQPDNFWGGGVFIFIIIVGRDSSVGMATRYVLDGLGIECRWGRDFPHPSRQTLGPSQLHAQWLQGLFPGGKAAGRGVGHPPPSGAEVTERVELHICHPGPLWRVMWWSSLLLLLLLLLSSSSSLLRRVFTLMYLKQTTFLGYTVPQLFCAHC